MGVMNVEGIQESLRVAIEIQRLRMRDQEVRMHEIAHKSVAGDLAGPVRYTYTRGPDGRMYVTGGEVPLRLKKGETPEETIEIAERIVRAALAPARPSSQDIAVAARATVMKMKALAELMREKDRGDNLDIRV